MRNWLPSHAVSRRKTNDPAPRRPRQHGTRGTAARTTAASARHRDVTNHSSARRTVLAALAAHGLLTKDTGVVAQATTPHRRWRHRLGHGAIAMCPVRPHVVTGHRGRAVHGRRGHRDRQQEPALGDVEAVQAVSGVTWRP